MRHDRASVTRDGWNTGTSYGSGGRGVRLWAFRTDARGRHRHGDHNGALFSSQEAADAFKVERGYCEPYVNQRVATFRAKNRERLRMVHELAWTLLVEGGREPVIVAGHVYACCIEYGADPLTALRFSNGVHTMARRLGFQDAPQQPAAAA